MFKPTFWIDRCCILRVKKSPHSLWCGCLANFSHDFSQSVQQWVSKLTSLLSSEVEEIRIDPWKKMFTAGFHNLFPKRADTGAASCCRVWVTYVHLHTPKLPSRYLGKSVWLSGCHHCTDHHKSFKLQNSVNCLNVCEMVCPSQSSCLVCLFPWCVCTSSYFSYKSRQ